MKLAETNYMATDTSITIQQGVTLRRIFVWSLPASDDGTAGEPISLEGYTVLMQFRTRAGGVLLDDWSEFVTVEPMDEDGVTPLTGQLHLRLGANVTDDYVTLFNLRGGVYELRLIDSGDSTEVIELVSGKVKIVKEIADAAGNI